MLVSQHANQLCRRPVQPRCPIPSPAQKMVRVCHRPQAAAKPLAGPGVSKLAAEMEPFAGCNCYYLLVSVLRHAGGSCTMHTQVSSSCRALHGGCKQLCSLKPGWDPAKVCCTCWRGVHLSTRQGVLAAVYCCTHPQLGALPAPQVSNIWAH